MANTSFSQLMDHMPLTTFRRCVARYNGERKVQQFSSAPVPLPCICATHLAREPARPLGIPRAPASLATQCRTPTRCAIGEFTPDFAQHLIGMARETLDFGDALPDLEGLDTDYALDATTIDLCLSVFPWAPFRSTKAAVKLHTLLDLRGNIPTFIHISDGKMHDVNVLDLLLPEPGAFYVMDRGYLDFERLVRLHDAGSFFVTRGKIELKAHRRYSHPVDRSRPD